MNSQLDVVADNTKRKRTNELIRMGRMVRETIATDGWLKVGFPLLQKMIRDSVGFYKDGEWYQGNASKEYAQALMDFQNRYMAYVRNIKIAENTLRAMDDEANVEYKIPMFSDGGSY